MSTAVMSTQLDIGETLFPNLRNSSSSSACRTQQSGYEADLRQWEMYCNTTTTTTTSSFYMSRHRNLSGPCTGSGRSTLDNRALATPPPGVPGCRAEREGHSSRDKENHHPRGEGRSSTHRKLDRSLSDSEDRINGNGRGVNSSRYKTELCRPFDESGHCKYGDKCQFAHGAHELRNLTRHPKYKTERCRTYHTIGFCPYGPRCHFIHNEDDNSVTQRKNVTNATNVTRLSSQKYILPPNAPTSVLPHRPSNLSGLKSLGSSFESVSATSSPGNLSPSHFDDQFPAVGTFSPSAVNDTYTDAIRNGDSLRTSPVFNFPGPDPTSVGSVTAPLDVQTQQLYYNKMVDMAVLDRFSTVMNISQNQHNNQSSYSTNLNVRQMQQQQQQQAAFLESLSPAERSWPLTEAMGDTGAVLPPSKSSSPFSDDSMEGSGSLEVTSKTPAISAPMVDNREFLVHRPMDMGRSMRLPIFNQFSSEL